MKEQLFEDFKIIIKEMQYYDIEDFKKNKEDIKYMYERLKWRGKKIYMWYVYSKNMRDTDKGYVWDYLNDNI